MSCDLASVEVDLGLELDAVAAHVRRLHVVQRSATSVSRGFISVLIALVPGYNELHSNKVHDYISGKSAHWRPFDVIKWPLMTGGFVIEGRNSRCSEARHFIWDRSLWTENLIPSQIFYWEQPTRSIRSLGNNPPHL